MQTFIGLLDIRGQKTISGPKTARIKISTLGGFGEGVVSYLWETSLHVFMDGALWTISSSDNCGFQN